MSCPHFRARCRLLRRTGFFFALVALTALGFGQSLTQVRNVQPPTNAVNIVFVSEGFTAAEQSKFESYASQLTDRLIGDEAYAWFANYINVYRYWVASRESGSDDPAAGIYRDTAFNSYVNNNLIGTNPSSTVSDALTPVLPQWSLAIVLVNVGPYTRGTGGGRIAYVSVFDGIDISVFGDVMLHETGHAFAGLADEYTRPGGTVGPTPYVYQTNVTSVSSRDGVPWSQFVMPWTPVPTTDKWYQVNEMDTIGVFPGAEYRDDLYRPMANSRMAGSFRPWGAVNLRAFATVVHRMKLDQPTAVPTITRQPAGGTVTIGQPFSLSVDATGAGPISYQWMVNGKYVPGGNHPTYTIPLMTAQQEGMYAVEVTNGAGTAVSTPVSVVAADPPGGRWYSQDIGAVAAAGHAVDEVAQKHVHSAGARIGGTSDACHFQYQPMSGDGMLTAEFVTYYCAQPPKAGIMLRESLDPGSPCVGVFDLINSARLFQVRSAPDADTAVTSSSISTSYPEWWSLQRTGDTITALASADGATWVKMGTATIPGLPATLYAGLAVSNEGKDDWATVVFRNTSVSASGTPIKPTISDQSVSVTANTALDYQLVAVNATRFTIVGPTSLPSGLSMEFATGRISGTPMNVGSTTVTIRASNAAGSSDAQLTIVVTAPPPVAEVPVVTNATIDGQVGTAIAPVQLQATHSPDAFTAPGLSDYGLSISNAGVVTGTPVKSADGVVVAFQASNSAGSSAPGAITLNLSAVSPPSSGKSGQTITFSSPTGAIRVGQPITLGATSSAGLPITYSVVSGDATINGAVLTPQSTATLVVRASSPGDATYAAASTDVNFGNPIPVGSSRLVNLSSRVRVSAGDAAGATIAGFFVTGTTPKQILIRGVGPSLTQFGVTNPVTAPQLKLYNDKNAVIATNAGWNNDPGIAAAGDAVAAFKLNASSSDAALLVTLAPGLYTAQVQSGNTGTALMEVYDVGSADPNPTKQLINISTRGYVGTDQDVLVAGFVVSGDAPKRILVRGVGPGITQFGVANVVSDPVLKLYDAHQAVIAQNNNWETPQSSGPNDTPATAAQVTAADTSAGAFPLAAGSTDAAMIVTLNPGQYTAIVSGANGGTGNAIVEVYEVP
jgi:hypothetical protein